MAEFTRRLLIYQTDRNSAKTLKVLSITTEEIQKPVRRKPLLPTRDPCVFGGVSDHDRLFIFTDGSLKSVAHHRAEIFGTMPGDSQQHKDGSAGIVVFQHGKLREVVTVPVIPNAVSCLSPYLTEAISIIGALIHLGASADNGTVILDCQSLFKAVDTFTKNQSGPVDSHLTECPYVTTIHNLVFNRRIKFI